MSHPGAVLCEAEIQARCEVDPPLIKDLEPKYLRGAKYDLRMANTGMVLPNGTVIKPKTDAPHTTMVLLEPGETIFVSTLERLRMPANLVGNMSIKGDLSRQGVLSLTGLIIDPGYTKGPSGDGRLHFRLANLGAQPVALTPGETAIASVQFLPLSADAEPPGDVPNVWNDSDSLKDGLGFIDDLRHLKEENERLRNDFENQRRSTEFVIAAAIGLILATMLGVVVTGLLSLGANSSLIQAARRVVPDDARGQWLFVLALFGLAAIGGAVTVAAVRGRRPLKPAPLGYKRTEEEAVRDLQISRIRRLSIATVIAAAITWGAVAVAIGFGQSPAIDVLAGIVAALVGAICVLTWGWQPITPGEVKGRIESWRKNDELKPAN
jgi:dCTP deaminase